MNADQHLENKCRNSRELTSLFLHTHVLQCNTYIEAHFLPIGLAQTYLSSEFPQTAEMGPTWKAL